MTISKTKSDQQKRRMRELGIYERDIEEHFVRSSGSGGQRLNKVSTCVVLKHLPTGIEVKCQKERSQAQNRYFARRLLIEKYEGAILKKKSAAKKRQWRIKKQKKRRSRRAKEKILKEKKRQSEKKRLRAPIK